MNNKKELFKNNLKYSRFRWLPLSLSVYWLIEGQHRTYQVPRWIDPEWKFRVYWSGSIEKPNTHILLFFYRLEFFISTPKLLVKYMKWRQKIQQYRFNKIEGYYCPDCGSHKLLPARGMAWEPIVYCNSCGTIVYEADPTPYII